MLVLQLSGSVAGRRLNHGSLGTFRTEADLAPVTFQREPVESSREGPSFSPGLPGELEGRGLMTGFVRSSAKSLGAVSAWCGWQGGSSVLHG